MAVKEKIQTGAATALKIYDVMGSTAGAGSGDFHHYRNSRRREMFRLMAMDRDDKREQVATEFQTKVLTKKQLEEAKTAKRAAKRHKAKLAKQRVRESAEAPAKEDPSDSDKEPSVESADHGSGAPASGQQPFKRAKVQSSIIHDDD